MQFTPGTRPIISTQGIATNPDTTTLIAQITGLKTRNYNAFVNCGSDTLAVFWVEQCLSTGFGSTAFRSSGANGELGRRVIYTPLGQTGTYPFKFSATEGDLIRVRINAAISAGTAAASITLEPTD